MSTITFDTHEFVKRLRECGFTEPQAEVITELQRKATAAAIDQTRQDYHLDELATKRDLDTRIKETELKIELVRAELKKDIKEVEVRLSESKAEPVRWVVGMGILQSSLLIGALMKMAHLI